LAGEGAGAENLAGYRPIDLTIDLTRALGL
jgi:hypothetical protein